MAASSNRAQRFRTLYYIVTEPHPSITSIPERYSVRLFAALTLLLAFIIFLLAILPFLSTFLVDPEWFAPNLLTLVMLMLLLSAWYLARRGYIQQMAMLVSVVFVVFILGLAYPNMGLWELNYLAYLVIPLIIANMFLRRRYSLMLLGVCVLGAAVIAWLTPDVVFLELLESPLSFVFLIFALQEVSTAHFRHLSRHTIAQEIETERLKMALEKERELSYLKDHLMATVAHEFKTPLSAIYTSTEMIERYAERLTPERRLELLHRIQAQVNSLSDMVSEVTLMRRMQGGAFPLEYSTINLRDFCTDLIRDYETFNGPDHSYTLMYKLAEEEVCVDMRLLRPIVANLLSNAVKYSQSSSPIRLEMNRSENWLLVAVEDEGVGIKLKDQTRIFEPFFRGENAPMATGTGLGLKIVKDCVALYGGEINFTSQEGVGTRFAVRLPLKSA